jgi:hypothetical protein
MVGLCVVLFTSICIERETLKQQKPMRQRRHGKNRRTTAVEFFLLAKREYV